MKNTMKFSRYLPHADEIDNKPPSICVGCGNTICDQYLFRVAPDLEWHSNCLKCSECQQLLDESTTCFVVDGRIFCKFDYIRLFVSQCAKCHQSFARNEFFLRTHSYRRFHLDCFRCDQCDRLLTSGDEYAIQGNHEILCRQHLSLNESLESKSSDSLALSIPVTTIPIRPPPPASSSSSSSSIGSNSLELYDTKSSSHQPLRKDKTTRMRTVLNEKQLLTLRTCYSANPRPDALMKEHLVEMTQLSPRVIRVWFQNKRCKDKKKSLLAKQTQEQQKVLNSLNHGIPLVASSPVPNDINLGLPSPSLIEVQFHSGGQWKNYSTSSYPSYHYDQRATFHDQNPHEFASEEESNCFEASQYSEERSDTSCDGSANSQLTLL